MNRREECASQSPTAYRIQAAKALIDDVLVAAHYFVTQEQRKFQSQQAGAHSHCKLIARRREVVSLTAESRFDMKTIPCLLVLGGAKTRHVSPRGDSCRRPL